MRYINYNAFKLETQLAESHNALAKSNQETGCLKAQLEDRSIPNICAELQSELETIKKNARNDSHLIKELQTELETTKDNARNDSQLIKEMKTKIVETKDQVRNCDKKIEGL
eukprot:Platyproteum_vivax@DN7480_c1_g1_i1.p1